MEEYLCEVGLQEIRVSPFQPRRVFSNEELKELSDSIVQMGLIQPPVVRKIMNNGKFLYYELIAGERRWRASMMANLKTIPVIVRLSTDEKAAEASLIENLQRVDLNPIEMAEAFRKLIDIFQLKQEEIAERVGKKRSTVANYLRLLSLPSPIREGIQKGAITMGHAKAILSLEDPQLKELLYNLILKNKLSVRESEEESHRLTKEKKKKKDIHITHLEESLEEKLQMKVRISHRGKGGKVTLYYHTLDDLDRFLAPLS